MAWLKPTGNVANGWQDPTYAYDDNTGTSSKYDVPKTSYSPWLELTHSAIECSKVRVYSSRESANIADIQVEVWRTEYEAWDNIYDGTLDTVDQYVEYEMGYTDIISAVRVRYYNNHGVQSRLAYVVEADFWEVEAVQYEYTGNLLLNALPASPGILDMVFVGSVGLSLLTSSVTARDAVSVGSLPIVLTPAGTYSLVEGTGSYEYVGNLPLALVTSYLSAMEYPYLGVLDTSLLPSCVSILDRAYGGSVPITLMPEHSLIVDRVYPGNLPLALTPEHNLIIDRLYGGALQLMLMPGCSTILDRLYAGQLGLELLPASTYSLFEPGEMMFPVIGGGHVIVLIG